MKITSFLVVLWGILVYNENNHFRMVNGHRIYSLLIHEIEES